MNAVFYYDLSMLEVFKRCKKFCEDNQLKQIETFFLLKEILKNKECTLYQYLKSKVTDEEIESAFIACVQKLCDKGKEEKAEVLSLRYGEEKIEFNLSEGLNSILLSILQDEQEALQESISPELEEAYSKDPMYLEIDDEIVLSYIIGYMTDDVREFMEQLNIQDISEFQKEYLKLKTDTLEGMDDFLYEFTVEEVGKQLILGRDKEAKKIWNILSKKNKRNAILVGPPGVGKTAVVRKLAEDIANGNCPKQFEGYKILALDMTGIVAGTMYRGQAEERFQDLNDFLENAEKVILFIDEIHTMLGAGACREGQQDLANSMKPILARGKAIVIGATTTEEYQKYFSRDGALKRRFEVVKIEEPKADEVYPMLQNKIKSLEEYHGVRIDKTIVDFIIFAAGCFNFETKNPDRTLDLVDRAMVVTKNEGKSQVEKEDVLQNFDANFEMFQEMSVDDQRSVAAHEAGHFVVKETSGLLVDYSTTAVSILPAECYLGVNVYEETGKQANDTLDYYIDRIASLLAGREAERMFSLKDNSGVSQDLKHATEIAYNVVSKFGMVKGYNIAYLNTDEVNMLSERQTDKINKMIQKILKKAEKRARNLLWENRDLLCAVMKELMDNYMLSRNDLDRIIREVKAK